jgi:hypothetical protein
MEIKKTIRKTLEQAHSFVVTSSAEAAIKSGLADL